MSELIHIEAVAPLDGYWVRLTFSNGAIKDVDLGAVFARGGVFAAIHDNRELFERVRVNSESQTIEWPGEVDLDPEVLYGRFEPNSGVKIPRRTLREPTTAHASGAARWLLASNVPPATFSFLIRCGSRRLMASEAARLHPALGRYDQIL